MATSTRLVDRAPHRTPDQLMASLVPPHRFSDVRFETYLPNPDHPSQVQAVEALEALVDELDSSPERPRRWRRRPSGPTSSPGRYLDGAYGVGKTHLLAALWHRAPVEAAYLTFAELTALIGFLGMAEACEAFSRFGLLCIDEFELDDVAHTLMAVTFLRHAVTKRGARVVTTSNSLPDRLGEGRFHAEDFRREIAAIAEHFEVVRIDGPDYRRTTRVESGACTPEEAAIAVERLVGDGRCVAVDELGSLVAHLREVPPVQYHALVDGLDAVVVRSVEPIANQGDALLWVRLVDELYDAAIPVLIEGCSFDEMFPASYRHGGYRKKYGRCLSRLASLAGEIDELTSA